MKVDKCKRYLLNFSFNEKSISKKKFVCNEHIIQFGAVWNPYICTSCLATIANDLINGYGMKPMCNCKLHYSTMRESVLTYHQRFSVAFSFVPGFSKLMFLALVCVSRKVVCVQALTIMLSNHDVRWTPACLPKCASCTFLWSSKSFTLSQPAN